MNLKSTTTNRFNFRITTSLMESCGLRLACLDCNLLILWIMCCLFLSYSNKSFPVILNSLVEDKPRENYINMSLNIFYLAWYFAHLIWILVNWSLGHPIKCLVFHCLPFCVGKPVGRAKKKKKKQGKKKQNQNPKNKT